MPTRYYKRYRMEIDLAAAMLPEPELPEGYSWQPWETGLEARHARVKFQSFCDEVDSSVFDCLGDVIGCQRLMCEISRQAGFAPQSTWLVTMFNSRLRDDIDCGTIQGVMQSQWHGAIQNVGVTPGHRGKGIGRALVLRNLLGFRELGIRRVSLEVTASNAAAVELYRRLGFETTRTMFRSVERTGVGV